MNANLSSFRLSNTSMTLLLEHIKQMNKTSIVTRECRNAILIFIYSLIIIVSIVGNLLVCKVIFANRVMTTTDKLIINLALSDLLMTVLNIPFNIVRFVLENWPFGETVCVLVPFIQSVSVHTSSITMMFIAIERYKSIFNFANRKCVSFPKILFLIWLASCLLSVPHGLFMRVVDKSPDLKTEKLLRCQVIYPEPRQEFRQKLTLFAFISQYVTPMLLTCICYSRISLFLWGRKIVGTVPECRRLSIMKAKIKRIKMLITVVLVFAICWLPLNVFHILTDFDLILYSSELFFTTHCFAMSSVWYVLSFKYILNIIDMKTIGS